MERFPPDLMLIAKRELGETPQVKRDAVAQLRKLLAEELALKYPLDEEFLVKFLRCRKYRVKETLEVIRKYFRVRREYTDIFDNLLPSRILFDEIFRQNKLISILKQPDAQGRLIVICKPGVWNPAVCPLVEFFRALVLSAEWSLLNEAFQIAGVVALMDMEEFHVTHLLHYTPSEIKRAVKLVQECYPVRLKADAPGGPVLRRYTSLGATTRSFISSYLENDCPKNTVAPWTNTTTTTLKGTY